MRKKIMWTTILMFCFFIILTPKLTAANTSKAFIPNFNSNNVSVIDIETDSVVDTIGVGERPFGVAVNEIIKRVYITNQGDNTISVVNSDSYSVIDTIVLENEPTGIAVNPCGTRLYVGYNRFNGKSLAVIDTSDNSVISNVDVGRYPWGIVVHPSGNLVYVVNRYEDESLLYGAVKVINAENNILIASIPIYFDPLGIAIDPSGKNLYVVGDARNLYIIDTKSNTVSGSVYIGIQPWGIAVNSTGSLVYVLNRRINFTESFNGSLAVFDVGSNQIVENIELGRNPVGIALSTDYNKIYIANAGDDDVYVLDTSNYELLSTIIVGDGPYAFGIFIDTISHYCAPKFDVDIDIKPGSYDNCININGRGVIPIAILGSADFDVTSINIDSLRFNGLEVQIRGNKEKTMCHLEDVSGDFTLPDGAPDGYLDLVCQFEDDPTQWVIGQSDATLTGELFDGTEIEGSDTICIVPKQ